MAEIKTNKKINTIHRGDIVLVDFDPSFGHEIRKTRPALVIQNNLGNIYSPLTIIAAITSQFQEPGYPTEVIVPSEKSGLPIKSAILLNQIRSIDKRRIKKHLGRLGQDDMEKVNQAITVSLGLIDL